jgi:TIR domain
VIQGVDPWVSSEDIEKGTWWNQGLIDAIEVSTVGIVVVTPENLGRTWINFEAGALARAIRPGGGIVAPLLVDVPGSSIDGPMGTLQVTRIDSEDDFFKLVKAINIRIAHPLPDELLRDEFRLKWPMLKDQLAAIARPTGVVRKAPKKPADEILEDLLSSFRELHRDVLKAAWAHDQGSLLEKDVVLDEVREAFESEGLTPTLHFSSISREGSVRIIYRDIDLEDEAAQRAFHKLSAIPKYQLLPTLEFEPPNANDISAAFSKIQRLLPPSAVLPANGRVQRAVGIDEMQTD